MARGRRARPDRPGVRPARGAGAARGGRRLARLAARAGVGPRLPAALECRRRLCPAAARQARPPVRDPDASHGPRRRIPPRGAIVTAVYARLRRRALLLPLRVRLALAGTVLLPFALAIVFGLVFLRFEASLNASIDGDLRARADALATVVARDGPRALASTPGIELLRPQGAFAQVVDRRGAILASSDAV